MKDSYALVTGASSGMGFCYAQQLAKCGYNLIMVSNEAAIHTKANEIQSLYPDLRIQSLERNLGTPTAAKELFDYCTQQQWTVEVLINNAGVFHCVDFIEDSEQFNALILNLHIVTPAMLCYYFGQQMAQRGKGYILNVSSITDRIAVQRLSTYASTKAFMSAFTRALHIELKGRGVFVTCVRPGAVDTGLYSISERATQVGKCLGYIVSPEHLVKRALKGLFRGKSVVSVPCVWNTILNIGVTLVCTPILRMIRKFNWF